MKILLSAGRHAEIDDVDFDRIKDHVWSFDGNYATIHIYVQNCTAKTTRSFCSVRLIRK